MGWRQKLHDFFCNRPSFGIEIPEDRVCDVPGCTHPAVESWFPACCSLREAGVQIEWTHVCAEHDVRSNEMTVRLFFGDRYDEELAAYRERRTGGSEDGHQE